MKTRTVSRAVGIFLLCEELQFRNDYRELTGILWSRDGQREKTREH
jgi:hypothetical protein